MDRDTILASFQEISQIQNFEECIQILESVNWDLQSALDSMDPVILTPQIESGMDHEFISYPPLPLNVFKGPLLRNNYAHSLAANHNVFGPPKELTFNVTIKGKTLSLTISEHKTINDLARLVASEINEPNTRLKINGLKRPYDDNTILRNMKLPMVNNVVANVIDSTNSVSAGSSSNQTQHKAYCLSIEIYMNDEFSQILPLNFVGKDSIGKVKSHLAFLTGTTTSLQKWSGWPKNICGSETTLEESGLAVNAHLIVHIDVEGKNMRRQNEFTTTTSLEASLNNSREIDNDDDDDADDYFADDIELADNETEISKKRSAALMDVTAHLDPVSAVIQFSTEFAARYCPTTSCQYSLTKSQAESTTAGPMIPPFFLGSIDDAISNSLNLSPHERKPLFLYLHHGESIQANIFCTQILCYSEVCLFFIQSDYSIWPWDITYSDNKSKLMSWIARNFGVYASSQLKIISKDQFPIIVVISKAQGTIEVMEIIDGMRTKEETVAHLWDIRTKFQEKQLPDIQAWQDRQLRDLVKQEQDVAYQESLLQDQQKEQLKNYEDQQVKEAEIKAIMAIEKVKTERQTKISFAASKLGSEPEEGPDTLTIRLRAPSNVAEMPTAMTRRFLYSHTLAHLIAYMESLGFLRTEFKLLSAFPRKNLTEIPDHSVTLKQLGIPKRETLTLEMV